MKNSNLFSHFPCKVFSHFPCKMPHLKATCPHVSPWKSLVQLSCTKGRITSGSRWGGKGGNQTRPDPQEFPGHHWVTHLLEKSEPSPLCWGKAWNCHKPSTVRRRFRILLREVREKDWNREALGAGDGREAETQKLAHRIQNLGLNCRIWNTKLRDRTEVTKKKKKKNRGDRRPLVGGSR